MRILSLVLISLFFLSACAPPYDRYMEEGRKLLSEKNYAEASKSFHKALLLASSRKNMQEKLMAALRAELECAQLLKDDDSAIKLLEEAASISEKSAELPQAASFRKQMGDIYAGGSHFVEAEECYEQGLAVLTQGGLAKSEQAASLLVAESDLKAASNNFNGALEPAERACAVMESISGCDAHALSLAYHKLAFIYGQLNRDNDSIEAEEKAKNLEIGGIKLHVQKLPKI